MSRAEIASYLGMKLETVSRAFSAFQQQGLLEVDKRHIRITDLEELKRRFDVRTEIPDATGHWGPPLPARSPFAVI